MRWWLQERTSFHRSDSFVPSALLSRVITRDFQLPLIRPDVSLNLGSCAHPSLAKFHVTIPDVGNGISENFPVFLLAPCTRNLLEWRSSRTNSKVYDLFLNIYIYIFLEFIYLFFWIFLLFGCFLRIRCYEVSIFQVLFLILIKTWKIMSRDLRCCVKWLN